MPAKELLLRGTRSGTTVTWAAREKRACEPRREARSTRLRQRAQLIVMALKRSPRRPLRLAAAVTHAPRSFTGVPSGLALLGPPGGPRAHERALAVAAGPRPRPRPPPALR